MKTVFSFQRIMLILVVIYTVGLLGLSIEATRPYFMALTPLNLLLTSLVVMSRTWQKGSNSWVWALVWPFLIGYFIEVAGVHTGVIFGEYQYGKTLGFKVLDVPLIIGLNWYFLSYISYSISTRYIKNVVFSAALGASMMVLLDVLIEPAAMALDMWDWKNHTIPMQNYIMWWITAFVIQLILHKIHPKKSYPYSIGIYAIQFVFFLVLNFTLGH